MRLAARSLSVCLILIWASIATAENGPYIENAIRGSLRSGYLPSGLLLPVVGGHRVVPVTLTLEGQTTQERLLALDAIDGVELRRAEGRPLARGRIVTALVTERGLARLSSISGIRRVSAGVGRGLVSPLNHTTSLVGVEAARRVWVGDHALTGEGVLLADVDTSIEVFHPDFFAADGGAFDWIDVDDDGVFSSGRDAVDLDRDGLVGEGEIARILSANPTDRSGFEPLPVRPEGFSAGWDWIYADSNGDGERNYGPNGGFDDDAPGFGEPLLIVDDIDGDDALGRDERLLLLGTSRIRAVYVNHPRTGIRIYNRGVDLTELPDAPLGQGAYGYPEAMHATGVLSIAAGGVPHSRRAMTGLAPAAEMLVAYDGGWDLVSPVLWVLREEADVVLHEYAPWMGVTLDGSDELSEVINDSTEDDGIVHVCPVGNTGGARKHAMTTLGAGETTTLELVVPPELGATYVGVSLHVLPGDVPVQVFLIAPSGERHDLNTIGDEFDFDGADAYPWNDLSRARTAMRHLSVWNSVPVGTWQFEITNESTDDEELTLHAYVQDEVSGWAEGAAWDAAIATDVSNIGLPSTAESCLAVGATTGHALTEEEYWFSGEEEQGEIRIYSGRGPRIDGLQKPDLVAPDNPFAAFPRWHDLNIDIGTYFIFGGTSGAGPHVAGAAVLLVQTEPEGGGGDVIRALIDGAATDELTGVVPNTDYGYGRISLAGALGVDTTGMPPTLVLEVPDRVAPGASIVVHPVVEDADGDASLAEIRWDAGYDGVWDGSFGAIEDLIVEVPLDAEERRFGVKAAVRDETGLYVQAVIWFEISTSTDGDGDADADADAETDGGGDSDSDVTEAAPVFSASGGACDCRAGGGLPSRDVFVNLVKGLVD